MRDSSFCISNRAVTLAVNNLHAAKETHKYLQKALALRKGNAAIKHVTSKEKKSNIYMVACMVFMGDHCTCTLARVYQNNLCFV